MVSSHSPPPVAGKEESHTGEYTLSVPLLGMTKGQKIALAKQKARRNGIAPRNSKSNFAGVSLCRFSPKKRTSFRKVVRGMAQRGELSPEAAKPVCALWRACIQNSTSNRKSARSFLFPCIYQAALSIEVRADVVNARSGGRVFAGDFGKNCGVCQRLLEDLVKLSDVLPTGIHTAALLKQTAACKCAGLDTLLRELQRNTQGETAESAVVVVNALIEQKQLKGTWKPYEQKN